MIMMSEKIIKRTSLDFNYYCYYYYEEIYETYDVIMSESVRTSQCVFVFLLRLVGSWQNRRQGQLIANVRPSKEGVLTSSSK
jgi:hypothetical protein